MTDSSVSLSVVIPAFNAADTLAETLDSLIAQTRCDWEAIIVDDGSSDQTIALAHTFVQKDNRFRLIHACHRGASAARNTGIAAATGRYLLFLDADDWIAPTYVETMLAALQRAADAAAAYCAYRRVFPDGSMPSTRWVTEIETAPFETFARQCVTAIHCMVIDKALIVELGGFDPSLQTCEDWDLWQRVARTGARFVGVREEMAFYRTGHASLSRRTRQLMEDARIVLRRGFTADPRVKKPAQAHANGAPDEPVGTCDLYITCNTAWCAAIEAGAGRNGVYLLDALNHISDLKDDIEALREFVVDGLSVGAGLPPAHLTKVWSTAETAVLALFGRLQAASSQPTLLRRIRYAIERRLLVESELETPVALDLMMGARVDIGRLAAVVPPEGVDLLYLRLCAGPQKRAAMEVPVFGPVSVAELEALAIETFGYAAYLKRAPLARGARFWPRCAVRIFRRILRRAGIARLRNIAYQVLSTKSRVTERRAVADRRAYWETLFESPDPWNYGSSYERLKYQRTLALLRDEPVGQALELACAEGHFTAQLAGRADWLVAADISSRAIERARTRCAGRTNIEFQQLDLVCDPLLGTFDLIVCSEVLYYLADLAQLQAVGAKLRDALTPHGRLLLAHAFILKDDMQRTGFDWEFPFGAAGISRVLSELPGLTLERSLVTELYRIDLFRRIEDDEKIAEPAVEVVPLGSLLEPEVARMVVWGGAEARRIEVSRTERTERLPVLMYHRVAETGPPGLTRYRVTPARFTAQMRLLRCRGYHAVSSPEIEEHFRSGRPFAGRPVMITFDDGYVNFREIAWPILRTFDFSAEVFVPTDMVGGQAFWDAAYGPPARLMDWADLIALRREGVRFGSHLASHSPADGLSSAELMTEAAGSRAMLEERLGDRVYSIAAPFGIVDERLKRVLAACGYRVGFSVWPGFVQLGYDPLNLPRIEVQHDWDDETFLKSLNF